MNRFMSSTNKERHQNLTIEELVEVDIAHSNNSLGNDWRDTCYTIKDKLTQCLHYGYFADVKFLVGQLHRKEIPAHKFILSLASSVFEGLFEGSSSNKTVNITVGDVEPDAFIAFLKFVYTDEFEVQVKDATAVLYLAKKYNIGKLVGKTGDFIMANISCKNVVSVLLSAEALGETSISNHARQFLKRNISYVIHENDFLQLSVDELCLILASDELAVNELELFSASIRWAVEECKRQKLELTIQNYRYVLQKVLPLIRFPLMDRKEFTFHVATKNILTDAECLNVLIHCEASARERANLPQLMFISKPRKEVKQDLENFPQTLPVSSKEREFYESYYYDSKAANARNAPPPPRRNMSTHSVNQIPPMKAINPVIQHQAIATTYNQAITPVYNQAANAAYNQAANAAYNNQQSWARSQIVGLPIVNYGSSDYNRF